MKGIAIVMAILFSCPAISQSDSLNQKFSFGFDGSRVFNQLFRANPYSSLLYLEYQFGPKSIVRLAGDLDQVSGVDGKLDFQNKLGYKRILKQKKAWTFYAGIDGVFEYEFNRNSQVEQFTEGGLLYIGATVKLSEHFSLSTEPSLYFIYSQTTDLDSFFSETKYSNSQGMTHVGLVRASFHF